MATPLTVGSAGGEYMEAVVVLDWHAEIGDEIFEGDLLVTVETAKAAIEVVSPHDGVLSAVFADAGSEVPVSTVLGAIGSDAEDTAVGEIGETPHSGTEIPDEARKTSLPPEPPLPVHERIVASPAAKREARARSIDLSLVRSSSPSGRIKLRDLKEPGFFPDTPQKDLPSEPGPLNVLRSGAKTGVPLVMLHGFGSDLQSWSPVERLVHSERPVFRIELPNHGASPRRPTANFRELAREIVDAFEGLGLEKAHLVGHSLGGACALALADIRPRRVLSLTLIAPGGLGPSINHDFLEGMALASQPDSLEQWLKVMVSDKKMIGRDFVGAAMAARSDPGLRAAQLRMKDDIFPDGTPGFDLRAALDRLECPTRIIWGLADRILPWRDALEAPGRVGVHLFPQIGHVPQLECHEDVATILRAVMNEGER